MKLNYRNNRASFVFHLFWMFSFGFIEHGSMSEFQVNLPFMSIEERHQALELRTRDLHGNLSFFVWLIKLLNNIPMWKSFNCLRSSPTFSQNIFLFWRTHLFSSHFNFSDHLPPIFSFFSIHIWCIDVCKNIRHHEVLAVFSLTFFCIPFILVC